MKTAFRICVLLLLIASFSAAQDHADIPELSTVLSLFSAHAGDSEIRVNWSLDSQSPTIIRYRVYRGYADAGHFAVLAEIEPHGGQGSVNYVYSDTLAIPGVTYYYKLGALGQDSESIFPVVISAALQEEGVDLGGNTDPVTVLPGSKLELYVRKSGHVKLALLDAEAENVIIDNELAPGIYELDPPGEGGVRVYRLTHDDSFSRDLTWPLE